MSHIIYKTNKINYLVNKYFLMGIVIILPIISIFLLIIGIIESVNNYLLILIISIGLILSSIGIAIICKEDILSNKFIVTDDYFVLPYSTWKDIKEKRSPKVKYEEIKDITFLSYGSIREAFPGDPMKMVYSLESPYIFGITVILKDGREYYILKRSVKLEGVCSLIYALKNKRKDIKALEHLSIPSWVLEKILNTRR